MTGYGVANLVVVSAGRVGGLYYDVVNEWCGVVWCFTIWYGVSNLGVVSAGRVDGLSHDVQVVFRKNRGRVVDTLSGPVEGCHTSHHRRFEGSTSSCQ